MPFIIRSSPDKFSPVYNPMTFYISSNNVNEQGFRYLVELYSGNTADRIASFGLFPRPIDGYGVVDINQILSSKVGYYIDQTLNGFTGTPQNYVKYDAYFGEEFVYYWPFGDTRFVPTDFPSSPFANGSYTTFTSFTQTQHYFTTGDTLVFTQGAPGAPDVYNNRVGTVVDVPNQYSIIVNLVYSGTQTLVTSGTGVYADYAKTQFFFYSSSTNNVAFNGAVPHQEFINYNSSAYTIQPYSFGSWPYSGHFLTYAPDNYRVRSDNKMWLNFWVKENTTGTTYIPNAMILETYNQAGNLQGLYSFLNPISGNSQSAITMMTVGAGPYNLENWNQGRLNFLGPTTNIFSGVSKYGIYLLAAGNTGSETKYFTIDDRCSRYTNYTLHFIDRLGSIIPVNFELNSVRNVNVTSAQYRSFLGDYNGTKWTYKSTDRGMNQINTTVVEQLTLQTDWMSENDALYLKQLFTSPVAYITENGNMWPVIIKTNAIPIYNKNNKKNLAYQIVVEYANPDTIQNF